MPHSSFPIQRALLSLLALAGLAAGATAQDALGDGRALDASLSTQTRYNAPRADSGAAYRLRNAVTTGNAPGGLSLRADVGYTAPFEFRGDLASDDLFAFRRDSLYSGLAGMGIRGTDAVQYQFALTTGSQLPQNLVGSGVFTRDDSRLNTGFGGAQTPSTIRAATEDELLESQRLSGLLRSPSSYDATRSLRPVYLGAIASGGIQNEQLAVSASSLRGIRVTELEQPAGSPLATDQRITTVYNSMIDSIRLKNQVDLAAGDPDTSETQADPDSGDWQVRLQQLREQMLRGITEPEEEADPQNLAQPDAASPGDPNQTEDPDASESPNPMLPAIPLVERPAGLRFDPETLELLRPDGAPVEGLLPDDAPLDSIYVRNMQRGQELLATSRYFDAEERFTDALSLRTGDVAAQVGRVHAQLGAGLFVSAGLNLRELVMTSPEIAAMRFAPGLLPGAERTEDLLVLLSERAGLTEGIEPDSPTLQRDTALLLAYLRYQRNETAGVREALDAAKSTLDQEERDAATDDARLFAYLTQLWTPAADSGSEQDDE